MIIIEPHIHMFSRTTDDFQAMFENGIRVAVEPSFWLGSSRRYAGTFWDYFQLILEFEPIRARRFGIDHYACVSVNPKEAENVPLANEVLDGLEPYLTHERCLAIGEIGFNLITPNEEQVFMRQLEMAKQRQMLVLIHTPHDTPTVSKRAGVDRTLAILRELNYDYDRIMVDHNTENTMDLTRKSEVWAGLTVYPYSKLNPERVADILKKWGLERTWVNSSADWGVSDPTSLAKVAQHLKASGFTPAQIEKLLFENPLAFYKQSGKFNPDFNLPFIHPREYQR
jgi:uncharacterized protein